MVLIAQRGALGAVAGGRDVLAGRALLHAGRALPRRRADHRLYGRGPDAFPVRADAGRQSTPPTRLVEALRGQRVTAFLLGIGFAGLLISAGIAGVSGTDGGDRRGARGGHNAPRGQRSRASRELLFTRYVFAFEITSALLITAALGAMVLAHKERVPVRRHEAARALPGPLLRRAVTRHPLPGPGVFAAGATRWRRGALLPDGSRRPGSVGTIFFFFFFFFFFSPPPPPPPHHLPHARRLVLDAAITVTRRWHRPMNPEHYLFLGAALLFTIGALGRAASPQRDPRLHVRSS